MIEIKVDGYTLFEMTTPKDVGYLRTAIDSIQETANDRLTEIANLRDERDTLRTQLAEAQEQRIDACLERDATRVLLNEAKRQMEAQKDEWLSWEAKRKGLEADAARYRWLTKWIDTRWTIVNPNTPYGKIDESVFRVGADKRDAAIDAAMKGDV